jgi:hypothetical protein
VSKSFELAAFVKLICAIIDNYFKAEQKNLFLSKRMLLFCTAIEGSLGALLAEIRSGSIVKFRTLPVEKK